MPSLLLGCGHSREKKIHLIEDGEWVSPLVTLDMGHNVGADVVWDLENRPLPFPDDYFDELGAYDVLEHIGKQGDWRGYFDEFSEYWRILKPGGSFGIIVPVGSDRYADPGHTRFFSGTWFVMLSRRSYDLNIARGIQITDYRWYWKKDFDVLSIQEMGDHHLGVMLRKPNGSNNAVLRTD